MSSVPALVLCVVLKKEEGRREGKRNQKRRGGEWKGVQSSEVGRRD
jgi:hypothetical protein